MKSNANHVMKILFTSIGRRVELVQAFRSAGNDLPVRVELWGADITPTAPALAFCDRTVIVPRISSPDYLPQLLETCKRNDIQVLIPTIDTDLLLLSKHKEEFRKIGTIVLVSAPEKISLCRDKRLTDAYFRSLGLHAPESVDQIEQYCGGYPAFIKPIDGSSSIGANRADSFEELAAHAEQLEEYIIQPFVSGTEYTVDIFCDFCGNPIYITPRIRVGVRSGEVLKTKIHHVERIVEEMLILIQDYQPCGPITVQLIRDEVRDVNHYIEINPRFGGGAPLSMKAGADAAGALLQLLMGAELAYQPNAAAEDAFFSRYDQSVLVNPECSADQIKAVVFDLDDTLYSEKEYVRSGYKAVAAYLSDVENAQEKLWDAFLKNESAIDYVLQAEGIYTEELKNQCLSIYRAHHPDIRLYDGAVKLLEDLRAKGIKLGILTDGRPDGQRAKIKALDLERYVDEIIITDELGGVQFRKPNDISFRIMQNRLRIPFKQMMYIGDNYRKDFQAPKTLGMQYIYFRNESGLYQENVSDCSIRSVSSFNELVNIL